MSEVKLTADSGGGTVAWKAPATTTSNAAVTLTLPQNDGDASQYLQTNGSGALSWAAVSVGGASNIAFNSGNGIDFSATADGTTMSSEVLDDYEEGYFTATCASSVTLHSGVDVLAYTKIGRMVHISGELRVDSDNSNANFEITNLPFASSNNTGGLEDAFNTCGSVVLHSWNIESNDDWGNAFMTRNTSTLGFKTTRDNGAYEALDAYSNGYISIGFSYMAAT